MLPLLMEHKLGGYRAALVVSPLVVKNQVCGLKKRGLRASILCSTTLVAKENIATVECLGRDNIFICTLEAFTTVK